MNAEMGTIKEETERQHVTFSTMGHVNHGKSTLIGFLLVELHALEEQEIRRIEREARDDKKEREKFAYILMREPDERKREMSRVVSQFEFSAGTHDFTVMDCPGHPEFVRNMIAGSTQADAGVLVVSAADYEVAVRRYQQRQDGKWVVGQAREHAYIAKILGINQMIVVISHMDEYDWNKTRYDEVVHSMRPILEGLEYGKDGQSKLVFLPVGGEPPNEYGKNVISKTDLPPKLRVWYDGPTFMEALEMLRPPQRPQELPLRIPIERVYPSVPGTEAILSGRIESGRISVGDRIIMQPSDMLAEVRSIKLRNQEDPTRISWSETSHGRAGDVITFGIRGKEKTDTARLEKTLPGDVVSHESARAEAIDNLTAKIYVVWVPNEIKRLYSPVLQIGTKTTQCVFEDIEWKQAPGSEEKEKSPQGISANETALVHFKLASPIVVDANIPRLSRFLIRDHDLIVAGGKIEPRDVNPRPNSSSVSIV